MSDLKPLAWSELACHVRLVEEGTRNAQTAYCSPGDLALLQGVANGGAEEDSHTSSAKAKKKKKAGKAPQTALGDEEIDALLMELDGPGAHAKEEPALASAASTAAAEDANSMMPGVLARPRLLSKLSEARSITSVRLEVSQPCVAVSVSL